MKKLAGFIVKRHKWILVVTLVLTVLCGALIPQVGINTDMTVYLADDSSMRQGLDLMEAEFGESGMTQTIRVMFTGLDASEKTEMQEKLARLAYVDSVDYTPDSADYNSGDKTLYVLHTTYSYGSPEELAIEQALAEDFDGYDMVFYNDNTSTAEVPFWIIAVAVACIMLILFCMCTSWLDPVLFFMTIAVAVVLNLGTNIIQGTVSNVTFAIAALLQMVLSMDYSIILMNRYRQELPAAGSPRAAMTAALIHAFPSVMSSSVTTIVGLLALVFMHFKIGADLGVVLAKGVFCSLFCVFTVLPGLILLCNRALARTQKKALHVSLDRLGAFSYRWRRVLAGVFVVVFVGAYFMQLRTGTSYTLSEDDPIKDVFTPTNTIVLVYDRQDDAAAAALGEQLEDDPYVKAVSSYATTLGKAYTAQELADALGEMDGAPEISSALLETVYYDVYAGGELVSATAGDFLAFLADCADDPALTGALDGGADLDVEQLEKFSDPQALTEAMTASELAAFFEMDAADVEQLMTLYFTENGGVATGTMTLPAFTAFLADEVAGNPDYAQALDSATLAQLETLRLFTDSSRFSAGRSASEIASLLGIDTDTALLLFAYARAENAQTGAQTMTLSEFLTFMETQAAENSVLKENLGGMQNQLQALKTFTDKTLIQQPMTAAQLAAALGLEESQVEQAFALYFAPDVSEKTMTPAQFTDFLVNTLLQDPDFAGQIDGQTQQQLAYVNQIAAASAAGTALTPEETASLFGLEPALAAQVFALAGAETMAPAQFTAYLVNLLQNPDFAGQIDGQTQQQLVYLNQIAAASAAGTALTPEEMASLFGLEPAMAYSVYRLAFPADITGKTMSLQAFVDFLLSGSVPGLDTQTATQLDQLQAIMAGALADTAYTPSQLAALLGTEESQMRVLYAYKACCADGGGRMSLRQTVELLLANSAAFGGSNNRSQLRTAQALMNASAAGTAFTASELAAFLGMDPDQVQQLYTLYTSIHGDTSGWRLSAQAFAAFVCDSAGDGGVLSGQLDTDTMDALTAVRALMDAVVAQESCTPETLTALLTALPGGPDSDTMELLLLYDAAQTSSDPSWTMSIMELVDYVVQEILPDARFAPFFDQETVDAVTEMQQALVDGADQLQGAQYGRIVLTVTLPDEGPETTAFFQTWTAACADSFTQDTYWIGTAAMTYELENSFSQEMLLITLLTVVSIFLVVALTFRSFWVPLILVLIVQCGVFLTVSVIGLQGYNIFYLALLMVQCILMGATIDYGILFCSYYREYRQVMTVRQAVSSAYNSAIHTIATSGLIMILATGIVGYCFTNPTISQICRTISIGALCATILILFLLPGFLCLFDKFVRIRKK